MFVNSPVGLCGIFDQIEQSRLSFSLQVLITPNLYLGFFYIGLPFDVEHLLTNIKSTTWELIWFVFLTFCRQMLSPENAEATVRTISMQYQEREREMCKRPTKSPNSLILGMSKLCAHHHLMFLVNEKNCSILVDIILEWGLIFLSLYWAISILYHNSKFGVRSIAYYAILLRFLRNWASHQEFAKAHFSEKLCIGGWRIVSSLCDVCTDYHLMLLISYLMPVQCSNYLQTKLAWRMAN